MDEEEKVPVTHQSLSNRSRVLNPDPEERKFYLVRPTLNTT